MEMCDKDGVEREELQDPVQQHASLDEESEEAEGDASGENTDGKDEVSFKMKVLQTLVLFMGVFELGLGGMLVGASLLDLEYVTQSDTATISLVVIGRSLGSVLGNITSGLLLGRINPWFMLIVSKFVGGAFTILAPWSRHVASLTFCFIPTGFANGFFDAAGNCLILLIWGKKNGPWMQSFHCLFSIGCLVAPLVAKPFLMAIPEDAAVLPNATATTVSSAPAPGTGSILMYAYMIVGLLMFLSGFCCLLIYLVGNRTILLKKAAKAGERSKKSMTHFRRVPYAIFLVLLAMMYGTYCAVEAAYSTFLLTFIVKHLGWSKDLTADVLAALMGAFTGGRALGIVIVVVLKPSVIILGDLTLMFLFLLVLSIAVNMHSSVVWISSVGLGFAMASVYGIGFTWTESHVGARAKVSTLILVASSVGEMSGPAMVGPLMDRAGFIWFAYSILALMSICLVSMIGLEIIGKEINVNKKRKGRTAADAVKLDPDNHCTADEEKPTQAPQVPQDTDDAASQ